MAMLEKEHFWACALSKAKPDCSWSAEQDEEESEIDINHTLKLTHACLGAKAKDKERNIVEVTTTDTMDKECISTILSLRAGVLEQCQLGLNFTAPASFRLIEGSGPVHLVGNHLQAISEDLFPSDAESDSEDEEMEEKTVNILKPKRPSSMTVEAPKLKKAKIEESKDEDDSEEEESDEEMEVEKNKPAAASSGKPVVKPTVGKPVVKPTVGKPAAKPDTTKKDKLVDDEVEEDEDEDSEEDEESGEDDESEEEEESEEEDESEEDDDEDDESDDEEDDEVTTALVGKKTGKDAAKKPMTNGVTPKKQETQKTPAKGATPKTDKKQDKTPGQKPAKSPAVPKDMNTIKQSLLKSPNLPKKLDKFKNFVKSQYKIDDGSQVKDLWQWLETNKK